MMRLIYSVVMLVVACGNAAEAQQTNRVTEAKIVGVQVSRWISVIVSVKSQQKAVVIAACGANESGLESLCQATVSVEGKRNGTWHPVERKNSERIIGGIPAEKWHPVFVTAERGQNVAFAFPSELYVIHPGEPLRLTIEGWPDESAMRSGRHTERVVSDEFRGP